jgi:LysM repeat protein
MVNRKLIFVFISVFLYLSQSFSQIEIVKRSNNKVCLSGKGYYIHIVRKGETLTAICKAYQVPLDSILSDNQQINDSVLKPNQYLKIRILEEPSKQLSYIYHKVEKGETLYSLSKRFNITIDEIYKLNPGSELGIKVDDNLKISFNTINNNQSIDIKDIQKEETKKNNEPDIAFIYHKVNKQETIYGIARQYNLTRAEIEVYNPETATKPIQPNELIKIPVKNYQQWQSEGFKLHKVLKQETIFGIAKLYHLDEKTLKKINTNLEDRELIEGELIKIPYDAKIEVNNKETTLIKKTEVQVTYETQKNLQTLKPDTLNHNDCVNLKYNFLKTYKVAFFLPLYLNINDTIGKFNDIITKDANGNEIVQSVPKQGIIEDKIYGKSKNFIEFYTGALLALENLKKNGVSFEVRVFDTRGDSLYVAQLLEKKNLEDFNLFIGPVFSGEMSIVNDYAWEHQINVVSPLSVKNSFIEHNPYAFQVSPTLEIQMKYSADFLNNFNTKNYIVIVDGNAQDQNFVADFKKQLFSNISSENLDKVKYNEYRYFGDNDSTMRNIFTPGIDNIVIVPSSDRAFVTDVMGKLNGYSYEFKIIVFGQHRWERFESIDLDHFHNTNTHRFSNSFIDYSNPEVIDFVTNYRLLLKTEPDRFAFQGYDITKYFCSALNKYGHDFRKCISFHNESLLQTTFNFVPYTDQGGYQNTAIYVLEYAPDYTLKKVATYPKQ